MKTFAEMSRAAEQGQGPSEWFTVINRDTGYRVKLPSGDYPAFDTKEEAIKYAKSIDGLIHTYYKWSHDGR